MVERSAVVSDVWGGRRRVTVSEAEYRTRLAELLRRVAYQKRPCQICNEYLYWVRTRNNEVLVFNAEGERHREKCGRQPVQAPVKARQDPLFGPDPLPAFDPVK